ncbi:MAG: molybdenum cofactor biosynthesis protein MoaE [Lentisphaeria bacterium]|nr:molybdenum cofactor biosynthesis protein MoaE [Lentisphaeria bacterium]
MYFEISETPIDIIERRTRMVQYHAGGYVSFEGWIRDHNHGKEVRSLEYQAYPALAGTEAEKILQEAKDQFAIDDCDVVHRVGHLDVGEIAVWVGVTAAHRGAAFDACEYIIDELKIRVPIWKNEHYLNGKSGWVECHECKKKAIEKGLIHE